MRRWNLAVTCVLLIQPLCSQVAPKHQTPAKNETQTNQPQNETQPAMPSDNKTINTPTPNNRSETHQRESSREFKWGLTKAELIMSILTAIYVSLTLAYVIVSGRTLSVLSRQAISMRRQTTQMRRTAIYARQSAIAAKESADDSRRSSEFTRQTMRDSERAQVYLDLAEIKWSPTGNFDRSAWLVLTIKNFGRTRAIRVSGTFKFADETPTIRGKENVREVHTILGAGQEHEIVFDRFASILDNPTFQKVLSGQQVLRFVGWFTYEDIFGDSYTTQCAGKFDPQTNKFTIEENRAG